MPPANLSTETEEASTEAAEKVFAVPELLENILKHLPLEDLFVFQRVNAIFQGFIKQSKAIRKAMLLEAPSEVDYRRSLSWNISRPEHWGAMYVQHTGLRSPSVQRAMAPLQFRASYYHQDIPAFVMEFDPTGDWYHSRTSEKVPEFDQHGS